MNRVTRLGWFANDDVTLLAIISSETGTGVVTDAVSAISVATRIRAALVDL